MSKVIWCSVHTPTTEQLEELESWLDEGELLYLKDINPVLFDTLVNSPSMSYELLGLAKTTVNELVKTYHKKMVVLRRLASSNTNALCWCKKLMWGLTIST